MNFRKLLTCLTVSTAAVIPFASAQNPTILQGSYISNVFGNSNFVLNPNAQTNVANVTTVTATVARSTTTPLVATSEFTVAIGTANGTATWATRAFDAGMKNQNCEARFTYRGFQATSKVQIKQSTNVVAELVLTPSATDPRIASINFPCGDLSTATTFVVTDTAILAGTNEIGGIYVGLATNMANVAQAENVVQASKNSSQSITGSAVVVYNLETKDTYGEFDTSNGNFTAKRAGDYLINSAFLFSSAAWTSGQYYEIYIQKNGTAICRLYKVVQASITMYFGNEINCTITLAVGDVIRTVVNQNRGATTNNADPAYTYTNISRFPSSSELVVTPERQNWYVSAYQGDSGSYPALGLATVASFTEITASGGTMTPESGSQPVAALCQNGTSPATLSTSTTNCGATNESLGIAFAIPTVGSYEVCAEFTHAPNQTTPNSTLDVYFQLAETNTNNTTILQSFTAANNGSQVISSGFLDQRTLSPCRVFVFNSVGTKAVRLLYRQTVSGALNGNVMTIDTNNSRALRWKIQPVTNQSNSALYVQGPVKAAETGAAIPAGYVGETYNNNSSADYFSGLNTYASVTLNPGVWMIFAKASVIDSTGAPSALIQGSCIISTNSAADPVDMSTAWINQGDYFIFGGTSSSVVQMRNPNGSNLTMFSLTSQQTVYLRCRLAYTAGSYSGRGSLRAIRLN